MGKSQKLKVGLVFDDSLDSNDGVAQYVKTVGGWLTRHGHEVRYLVGQTHLNDWEGGKVYSLARNQTVFFNGNKLSVPLPANKKRIRRILNDERFDILHIMMPYSPFMAQKVINSASPGTAIVGTFHIFPSGRLSTAGSMILKSISYSSLKKFSAIASVSSAAAQFAKSAFGLDTAVIPNPVSLDKYAATKPDNHLGKNIVFLGRLVKRKGAKQLIDAFSLLSLDLPEVRLIIAGDGPERLSLDKLVNKLGISERVSFKGLIDEADKPSLLASADVACFPSLYGESFGIVLIEAMAAGSKVVLGGDNPGYKSVLGGQPTLLVNPYDSQEFADRLKKLLTDEEIQRQVQKWQQNEVKQYDIDVVGRQITKVYDAAIARLNKKSDNGSYER